jgi:hypothetical protein
MTTADNTTHQLDDTHRRIANILKAYPAETWDLDQSQAVLEILSDFVVRAQQADVDDTLPPSPPDATEFLTGWIFDSDELTAVPSRVFRGRTWDVGVGDVTITGVQFHDGGIERHIVVLDTHADRELDAAQARQLAAALIEAANELDRLR